MNTLSTPPPQQSPSLPPLFSPLDIPELRQLIFYFLQSSKSTLATCALVSTHWAIDTRRFLWESVGDENYGKLLPTLDQQPQQESYFTFGTNSNHTTTTATTTRYYPPTAWRWTLSHNTDFKTRSKALGIVMERAPLVRKFFHHDGEKDEEFKVPVVRGSQIIPVTTITTTNHNNNNNNNNSNSNNIEKHPTNTLWIALSCNFQNLTDIHIHYHANTKSDTLILLQQNPFLQTVKLECVRFEVNRFHELEFEKVVKSLIQAKDLKYLSVSIGYEWMNCFEKRQDLRNQNRKLVKVEVLDGKGGMWIRKVKDEKDWKEKKTLDGGKKTIRKDDKFMGDDKDGHDDDDDDGDDGWEWKRPVVLEAVGHCCCSHVFQWSPEWMAQIQQELDQAANMVFPDDDDDDL